VNYIDKILQQQMTRKQFLGTLLVAVGGLFGFATFFGALSKGSSSGSGNPGYGKRHYGP
jgi:hypothetical protein